MDGSRCCATFSPARASTPTPGETNPQKVRAVAEAAGEWQLVQLVLAGASLCGIGSVLALWRLIPRDRFTTLASVTAALG